MMVPALLGASTQSTARVQPGLTIFFIGLTATVIGCPLAFDIRGMATKIQQNNSEFTPWGRRHHSSQFKPNPARLVGWCFFLIGVALLGEDLIAGLVYLARLM